MNYDIKALIGKLSNEYSIEEDDSIEFGACRLYKATTTDLAQTPVWVYVPRQEVWAVQKARVALSQQFQKYFDLVDEWPSLPFCLDYYTEKKSGGASAIVIRRYPEQPIGAQTGTVGYPNKQGAMVRLVETLRHLESEGIPQPLIGLQTVNERQIDTTIELHLDFVFFGSVVKGAPAPSLIFDPAFIAPEFANLPPEEVPIATVSSSGPAHVYATAKYLIYTLAGPEDFLEIFSNDVSSADEVPVEAAVMDAQFWANLAASQPEPDRTPLDNCFRGELSSELVELLMRSVSYAPENRPANMAMFHAGLMTTVGRRRGSHEPSSPKQPRQLAPANRDNRLLLWGGISTFALLLLGGAIWYSLDRAEHRAELEAQRTDARQTCLPLFTSFGVLRQTPFSEHSDWDNLAVLVNETGTLENDDTQLATMTESCIAGIAQLQAIETSILEARRVSLEAELAFSRETGAAGAGVDVSTAEALLRQPEDVMSPVELEVAYTQTERTLILQHGGVLRSNAEALLATTARVKEVWEVIPAEDPTVSMVESLRTVAARDIESLWLRTVYEETRGLHAQTRQALASSFAVRSGVLRDQITQMREELGDLPALIALSEDLEAASGAADFTSEAVQARYRELDEIADGLAVIGREQSEIQSAVASLVERVQALRDQAAEEGWDEDAALAELLAEATALPTSNEMVVSWRSLTARALARADTLEQEWRAGRTTCAGFRTSFAETGPRLEGLPVYGQLLMNDAAAAAANADQPVSRTIFALCDRGGELLQRGAIELEATDAIANMRAVRETALNVGVNGSTPGFAEIESEFESTASADLPGNEIELDQLRVSVRRIENIYEDAVEQLAVARVENGRLVVALEEIEASAEATGLSLHPVWRDLRDSAPSIPPNDIFGANRIISNRISTIADLLARFEAGEFIDCTNEFFSMVVATIGPDMMEGLASELFGALNGQDGSRPTRSTLLGQHCIGVDPVSISDLLAWDQALMPVDRDIKIEIAATLNGPQGVATNVSYYLAENFAEWLTSETNRTYCVAPAALTRSALDLNSETLAHTSLPELTGTPCDGDGDRPHFLVLDPAATGADGLACEANNDRLENTVFRISSGTICGEE